MPSVLVIDDDEAVLTVFARLLRTYQHDVRTARGGAEALAIIARQRFDVVVCDLLMPGMSGLEVLRHVREAMHTSGFVIISGAGSMRDAMEAGRLGAVTFLEKPVESEALVEAVRLANEARVTIEIDAHAHAAQRWADAMVAALVAPTDSPTLRAWASQANVSVGTLRNWCHTLALPPKKSLNLARMLRAWTKHQQQGAKIEHVLDVVDTRTLQKLLDAAGLGSGAPATLQEFLQRQRFLTDTVALEYLRRAWMQTFVRTPSNE